MKHFLDLLSVRQQGVDQAEIPDLYQSGSKPESLWTIPLSFHPDVDLGMKN